MYLNGSIKSKFSRVFLSCSQIPGGKRKQKLLQQMLDIIKYLILDKRSSLTSHHRQFLQHGSRSVRLMDRIFISFLFSVCTKIPATICPHFLHTVNIVPCLIGLIGSHYSILSLFHKNIKTDKLVLK